MINRIKRHLKDNSGDENTSKMTWVAIVFVIGAILLLLTTTAFKEPIQEWYENTVAEWFADENGQYSFDIWSMYERNENGTYKDLQYICYNEDGSYTILTRQEDLSNNLINGCVYVDVYNPDGSPKDNYAAFPYIITISNDGRTIYFDDDEAFHAQLP